MKQHTKSTLPHKRIRLGLLISSCKGRMRVQDKELCMLILILQNCGLGLPILSPLTMCMAEMELGLPSSEEIGILDHVI